MDCYGGGGQGIDHPFSEHVLPMKLGVKRASHTAAAGSPRSPSCLLRSSRAPAR